LLLTECHVLNFQQQTLGEHETLGSEDGCRVTSAASVEAHGAAAEAALV
jgi:hypothetical protein